MVLKVRKVVGIKFGGFSLCGCHGLSGLFYNTLIKKIALNGFFFVYFRYVQLLYPLSSGWLDIIANGRLGQQTRALLSHREQTTITIVDTIANRTNSYYSRKHNHSLDTNQTETYNYQL